MVNDNAAPGVTAEQISAACIAYDFALPEGVVRPEMPAHIAAMTAALVAALNNGVTR